MNTGIFEDDREFLNAPYFNHDGDKPYFNTNKVANANDNYGSPFVAG